MDKKKIVIVVEVIAVVCIVACIGVGLLNRNGVEIASNERVAEESTVAVSLEESENVTSAENVESAITTEISTEISTENTTEISTTNGQLETPSNTLTEEEGAYYIKENADGTREYSPQMITDLMGSEKFAGLTYDEITTVLDEYIPDEIIGDPAEDEAIRDYLSILEKDRVYRIVGKEQPADQQQSSSNQQSSSTTASQGQSSNSNQSTNQSQSSNQNATQGQTSQQQQTNPQPMQEPTLTQEELNELYGEGGRLSHFNDAPEGHFSGESLDWVNGR